MIEMFWKGKAQNKGQKKRNKTNAFPTLVVTRSVKSILVYSAKCMVLFGYPFSNHLRANLFDAVFSGKWGVAPSPFLVPKIMSTKLAIAPPFSLF